MQLCYLFRRNSFLILVLCQVSLFFYWYATHPQGRAALQASRRAYKEQKNVLAKTSAENIRLKETLADLVKYSYYKEKIIREDLQMGYPDEHVYILED